jgi:hypothetical protein
MLGAFQSQQQGTSMLRSSLLPGSQRENDLVLDADFTLDDDGNIIDLPSSSAMPSLMSGGIASYGLDGQTMAAQNSGLLMDDNLPMDLDLPPLTVDDPGLRSSDDQIHTPPDTTGADPNFMPTSELELTTISAKHPLRRRTKKLISLEDKTIDLRKSYLRDWDTGYLGRMREATVKAFAIKKQGQGKRNADHWILGMGLFGVGAMPFSGQTRGLAGQFSGAALFKMVTGNELGRGLFAKKRKAKANEIEDDGSDDSGRRVRGRQQDQLDDNGVTLMSGALPRLEDDAFYGFGPDSDLPEHLRAGPSNFIGIDDISNVMPWNTTASIRGSAPGTATGRHGSRVQVSASPFPSNRPSIAPLVEISSQAGVLTSDAFEPIDDFQDIDLVPDSFGAQLSNTRLDKDSRDFYDYVTDAIRQKHRPDLQFEEVDEEVLEGCTIEFGDIFPAEDTTKRIAANAFAQVLQMGTKGMLKVEQMEEQSPEIVLTLLSI